MYFDYTESNVQGSIFVSGIMLEEGNKASDWSPHPDDPASGVKTSHITIESDHIDIASGGSINIVAGAHLNIRGGSSASAFGISTNDPSGGMIWGGHATPTSAAFFLKKDGSGKIGGFNFTGARLESANKNLIITPTAIGLGGTSGNIADYKLQIHAANGYIEGDHFHLGVLHSNGTEFGVRTRAAGQQSPSIIWGNIYGNFWVQGNISGDSFTDRTPGYDGDALDELRWVDTDDDGGIDHNSLPAFAQRDVDTKEMGPNGQEIIVKQPGRSIGAMISILTRAMQQLDEKILNLEGRIGA